MKLPARADEADRRNRQSFRRERQIKTPDVRERLQALGANPAGNTGEEFPRSLGSVSAPGPRYLRNCASRKLIILITSAASIRPIGPSL